MRLIKFITADMNCAKGQNNWCATLHWQAYRGKSLKHTHNAIDFPGSIFIDSQDEDEVDVVSYTGKRK